MSIRRSLPGTTGILREACADLARRLRAGETAATEQYLETFPALADDDDTAVELIYSEFALLEELGRRPDEDAFLARFPKWHSALRRQFDVHRLLAGAEADGAPDRDAPKAEPDRRFGAYEIVRPLGRGGMGTVYLARHRELGRLAAVKVLHGPAVGDRRLVERFRAEVRSAAALGHPGIVQLYELGESSDGRQFAAFEYLEGGSLQAAQAGRPRSAFEAADIVARLADAVDCAHRAGIVHCDLTPANVLIDSAGLPKVADFGLARLPRSAEPINTGTAVEAASPTQTGEIDAAGSSVVLAGTPGYLAPERIERPDLATPAVDVYGLGAVFYELLSGRAPHVGATPWETLQQARDFDPPPPRELVPSIPRDASTIALKCLARDPARRYADAAALAADLRRFIAGEPITARPVGSFERAWKWARRRPGLTAALGSTLVAVVALIVGGWWYNVQLRDALERTEANRREIAAGRLELAERVDRQRRDLFTLQLNRAEALVERAPHQARALLEDVAHCPGSLRDFAWGLLMRRASQERRTLLGHTAPVLSVVAPTDQALVTAATDDRFRLWNMAEAKVAAEWTVDTADAAHLCLSPDGRRLAAAFDDGSLKVWTLTAGAPTERSLQGHLGRIAAVEFFADGKWLVSAGEEGDVRIWDPAGLLIADFHAAEAGEILSLAPAPDGATVAVGLSDGRVRIVSAGDGAEKSVLADAGGAALRYIDEGRRLLTSNLVDGRIAIWNTASWQREKNLDTAGAVLRSLTVDRRSRLLAHADADQTVRVIDLSDGRVVAEYRGHADRIGALAFNPACDVLVTASDDRTIKLWDVPGRPYPRLLPADESKTLAVDFDPAGKRVAVAGYDTTIRILSTIDALATDEAVDSAASVLSGHSGAVNGVRFVPGAERCVSAGEDGSLRLWDLTTRATIRTWEHPDWVLDVVVEADGKHCWTACADGFIRRFDLESTKPVLEFKAHDGAVNCLALLGPSGVISGGRDGTVRIWGTSGKLFDEMRPPGRNVQCVAQFGRKQRIWIAVGFENGEVMLGTLNSLSWEFTLRGHTRSVSALAFSPDGHVLASATGGRWIQSTGETQLWDVATGQVHATLEGLVAPLAFRPDGGALVGTLDARHRIAVWETVPYQAKSP